MHIKQIHPWFRNAFITGCLLSLMAAIQLFVLSEKSDTYFAWTISSTLTAATLGSFYFGTMVFGYLSAREKVWAVVRGPAVGLLFFVTVSMVATLLHLDKFHLGNDDLLPKAAAWIWLAIYVLFPIALVATFVAQMKQPGTDPQRTSSLPTWYRILLLVHFAAGLTASVGLFFVPISIIPFFPWSLTPLTARALSAWLLSFGVLDLMSVRENDWTRVRVMAISYVVSAGFSLIALLRYAGQADLTSMWGVGYLLYLGVMLGCGAYGWGKSMTIKASPFIKG